MTTPSDPGSTEPGSGVSSRSTDGCLPTAKVVHLRLPRSKPPEPASREISPAVARLLAAADTFIGIGQELQARDPIAALKAGLVGAEFVRAARAMDRMDRAREASRH